LGSAMAFILLILRRPYLDFFESLSFAKKLAEKGGKILFVGTKRQARDIVRQEAERAACHTLTTVGWVVC